MAPPFLVASFRAICSLGVWSLRGLLRGRGLTSFCRSRPGAMCGSVPSASASATFSAEKYPASALRFRGSLPQFSAILHLNKQLLELFQVDAPKLADPGVVGVRSAGDHAEGNVLMRPALDLPGRKNPYSVGVQEERHHHLRVMRRVARSSRS